MIITVAAVIVNSEAFVDPRLDSSAAVIRDILQRAAGDRDSFELLTVNIVPKSEEDIRRAVSIVIARNCVDWVLVVGGIGFEDRDCTPEAIEPLIDRPALTIITRILANVQDPYCIRPIAGTASRTVIVAVPGDNDELRSVLNYFTTSALGFVNLLSLPEART